MNSVHMTTDFVSSNPVRDEMYLIQHYLIKFVGDLWRVSGFLPDTPVVSCTNKTVRHHITEILLKMGLSTMA
jgi:hypothetical protein